MTCRRRPGSPFRDPGHTDLALQNRYRRRRNQAERQQEGRTGLVGEPFDIR